MADDRLVGFVLWPLCEILDAVEEEVSYPSCRRRIEDAGNRNRKCTTTPDAEPRCMLPSNAAGEGVLNRDVVGGINIGLRVVYYLRNIPLSTRPVGM